jgi:predicted short-subunit dehydrogenase-like oxidoreductase (DUF2520 family)
VANSADISVIGPGKVGTALGVLAARSGLRVAVGGRRREAADAAAEIIQAGCRPCTPPEAAAASSLVLLTVSDAAIQTVCEELAEAFGAGAVVAHCSGVLDSGVLAAARRARGCEIGSMHPLQTFPAVATAVATFQGTYCFIEGSSRAMEVLSDLAGRIGGNPQPIPPGKKPLYHAAAVVACNYLTGLLDAASALAEQAGIDRSTALAAMEGIVRATVENVFAMGPAAALTGPIARGEADIVRRHLQSMRSCPDDLQRLYRAVGRWTIDLARRKGTIRDAQGQALRDALRSDSATQ